MQELAQQTNAEAVEECKNKGQGLIEAAIKLSVACQQDADNANILLNRMNAGLKAMDNKRLAVGRPILAAKKALDDMFKNVSDPVKEAMGTLKNKLMSWRRVEQERIDKENRKAQEAAQKELERRQNISKSLKGDGEAKTPVAAPIQQTFTDTTKVSKVWQHTVVDAQAVPRQYLEVDEVKIRRHMQDHIDKKTKLLDPDFKIAGVTFEHVDQGRF
ncbi:hypothetical protein LCGC14_0358940 [marine sediment metagenome]|uniref:Uncharacterized protein n=1 Tax=marine sediment metagenome TaxID=412755 RepID=A0A0F9TEG7_9ZZZZ